MDIDYDVYFLKHATRDLERRIETLETLMLAVLTKGKSIGPTTATDSNASTETISTSTVCPDSETI